MRTNNATRLADILTPTQYRRSIDRLTLGEWITITAGILGLPVDSNDVQNVALGVMRHFAGDHTPVRDCLDSIYWDIILTHKEGYHFGEDLLRSQRNGDRQAHSSDLRLRHNVGADVSTDAVHDAQLARTDAEEVKYDASKLNKRRRLRVYKDTWESYDPFLWLGD